MMNEAFNKIRAQEAHEIRLGASMGVLGLFGSDFFEGFGQEYPNITINYKEHDDENIDRGLNHEFFDLALTLYPYDSKFVTTELFSTPIAFWVHEDSPLNDHPFLTVHDLENQVLAWPGKGYKINKTLIEACENEGVDIKNIYETDQMFVIFDFVQNGNGLGFTLPQLANFTVFSENTAVKCILSQDIELHCGLSHLPSHALTQAEQQFYDYCIEYVRINQKLW